MSIVGHPRFGYTSPADLTDSYPQFFWSSILPHIQTAIPYLNVTSRGRQWIAGLYRNVLRARRRGHPLLDEPQPKTLLVEATATLYPHCNPPGPTHVEALL